MQGGREPLRRCRKECEGTGVKVCVFARVSGEAPRRAKGEQRLPVGDPLGTRRRPQEKGVNDTPRPSAFFSLFSCLSPVPPPPPLPSPPLGSGGQKSSSGACVCGVCVRVRV